MRNIHKIYTTKATRLHDTFGCLRLEKSYDLSPCNLNVYITKENEDIHDGDFIITNDGRLVHVTYLLSPDLEGASKVVLTSDQALVSEGVQSTEDKFLKWLVANPDTEKVTVTNLYGDLRPVKNLYQIITPYQAIKLSPTQKGNTDSKTPKEEADNFFNDERVKTLEKSIEYLLKRQAKMYSEEEVKNLIESHSEFIDSKIDHYGINNATTAICSPEWDDEEWFNEKKKK